MNGKDYKKQYDSQDFCERMTASEAALGADYTFEETVFRVWVPNAEHVSVKIYSCGTPEEASGRGDKVKSGFLYALPMKKLDHGIWEASAKGDLHGFYYTYEVCRDNETLECVDIYAKACGANGQRGMIVDLRRTDPQGWEEDKNFRQTKDNTVIYELHVKDFSYHQGSGVSHSHRGKYLAFTEDTGKEKGISYLRHLGISHVHLLPFFDFASVDETGDTDQFNWGYDPQNYNVPEGSYATDVLQGEVRIRECKQMIQALHNAGIGVVMDVVYNHTYNTDSSFQALASYYYYRQDLDGGFSNGSGCGNETASERIMCGKFIRESVLYWAEEYHVDGFRFDLMGLHDTGTLNSIRYALNEKFPDKQILMYGEPWTGGESPMGQGFFPAIKKNVDKLDEGIAIFCDDTRDVIKGSVFDAEEPGFVNGGRGLEAGIASAYQAWCDGGHNFQPISPKQIISYVSVHDNYTLWDKLVMTQDIGSLPDYSSKRKDILAMNKLTAGILFTCLGTPLFQAGEEFGRTKYGDENSYRSSSSINCLDWDRKMYFDELTEYYRGLIALRARIPLYRKQTPDTVKAVHILKAQDGRVEVCLDLTDYVCEWKKLYLILNVSQKCVKTVLPVGEYQKLVDEKSSWQWKKKTHWSRISKKEPIMQTAPISIGIWGEI